MFLLKTDRQGSCEKCLHPLARQHQPCPVAGCIVINTYCCKFLCKNKCPDQRKMCGRKPRNLHGCRDTQNKCLISSTFRIPTIKVVPDLQANKFEVKNKRKSELVLKRIPTINWRIITTLENRWGLCWSRYTLSLSIFVHLITEKREVMVSYLS